uniref:Protein kinase domain-containing protein n=1 Tax=Chenopodium quinoa TaxID=63459 RepID=A0A803N4K0_CHEQI
MSVYIMMNPSLVLIMLSMICVTTAASDIEIVSSLRKSLIRRKDTIPSWSNMDTPVCNLTGVECGGSKVVLRLKLPCSSSALKLPIPSSIGELKHLKFLNLSQCVSSLKSLSTNLFSGKLPPELGKLSKLESLDLTLVVLFFSGFGKLTNLKKIDLSSNSISGPIPKNIGNLKNLTSINLVNNSISGVIPSSIGKLRALHELRVRNCKLTGAIPSKLTELPNLASLDIGQNSMIPSWISNWKQVESITMAENLFTGSMPSLNLQNLRLLDMSSNMLSGELSSEICNLKSIENLSLPNNNFTGSIEKTFRNCSGLTELILFRNNLSGELPAYLAIILDDNFLSGKISPALAKVQTLHRVELGLVSLDLSSNNLIGHIPKSVSRLKLLDNLHYPGIISQVSYQKRYALDSKRCPCQIPNTISIMLVQPYPKNFTMKNLQGLILSHNMLSGAIPDNMASLMPRLAELDISWNFLSGTLHHPSLLHQSLCQQIPGICAKSCTEHAEPCLASAHRPTKTHVWDAMIGVIVFVLLVLVIYLGKQWILKRNASLRDSERLGLVTTVERGINEPLSINLGIPSRGRSRRAMAVKRLDKGHFQDDRQFLTELETIGKVQHRNLVPLVGYCVFAEERFLVYEYMENGSLDELLWNRDPGVEALDWPTRFKICLGAAQALPFCIMGLCLTSFTETLSQATYFWITTLSQSLRLWTGQNNK